WVGQLSDLQTHATVERDDTARILRRHRRESDRIQGTVYRADRRAELQAPAGDHLPAGIAIRLQPRIETLRRQTRSAHCGRRCHRAVVTKYSGGLRVTKKLLAFCLVAVMFPPVMNRGLNAADPPVIIVLGARNANVTPVR